MTPDLRLCFSFNGGVPRSARGCLVTSLLSSLEYERILFVNYDRDEKVVQCSTYTYIYLVVFGLNPDIRGVHSIPMAFTLPKGILPWMTTEVPDHGRALAQA